MAAIIGTDSDQISTGNLTFYPMTNIDIVTDYEINGAIIGSGAHSSMGNIEFGGNNTSGTTINITSKGTDYGAVIGSGVGGSCSDIIFDYNSSVNLTTTHSNRQGVAVGAGSLQATCGDIYFSSTTWDNHVKINKQGGGTYAVGFSKGNDSNSSILVHTYQSSYISNSLIGNNGSSGNSVNIDSNTSSRKIIIDDNSHDTSDNILIASNSGGEVSYSVTVTPYSTTQTNTYNYEQITTATHSTQETSVTFTGTTYKVTDTTVTTTEFFMQRNPQQHNIAIHHGDKANQAILLHIEDMHTAAMGLDGVAVTTREKATDAIGLLDTAIEYALDQSTSLGAAINRLEYTESNLVTANENTISSESTIRDADMAKAMVSYTKNNVLLQASQSMLAQANQNAGNVLSLLQ